MASVEQILRTFRYRPRLAPELLREVLDRPPPAFDGVRVEALDGSAAAPQQPCVVVLTADHTPVRAIVVDAPDGCDNAARTQWPRWVESVAARLSAPAVLLIVTPDPTVERWARQPVHGPGDDAPFEPLVLGPSAIPSDPRQSTPVLVLMTLASSIVGDA